MRPLRVLAISGALGFLIGILKFPSWQVAVESAQVVAGIVQYPPGNPFYIYHTKLWTLLHQAGAVLLLAGVSEIVLSRILSGLMGMLSFQALAMFVYGVSGRGVLAVGSATVIFLTGVAELPDVYPVILMGTTDTYGAVGLSTCALVLALAGAGCLRSAAFLLGLVPAVHPALGVWLWLAGGLAVAWDFQILRREFNGALKYLLAGSAVTGVSLLVQLAFVYDVPHVDPAGTRVYFDAFVTHWDFHRAPVRLVSRAVAVNLAGLVVASLSLVFLTKTLSPAARFAIRVLLVCSALGLIFVPLSWIPPHRLPATLLILMPSRLLSVNVLLLVPLVLGLLGSSRQRLVRQVAPVVLLGAMLIVRHPLVRERARLELEAGDFRDRSNNAFFAAVAAEPRGLLLTGGSLHLMQLATRRPVLLDGGGLDTLPYAIESGPEMQRILREVYGIDLLRPPNEARQRGVIPDDLNKAVWQRYSITKWQEIADAFNVTQVITPADWSLNLPLAARSDDLRLYRIPE